MSARRALLTLPLAALLLGLAQLPAALAAPAPSAAAAGVAQATVEPRATEPRGDSTRPAPLVRTDIDQALTPHLQKLLDFQSAYSARGVYYQTLESHTTPPADGQLVAPDRLDARPTDQAEKLEVFWGEAKLAPELPYSFRVDVYDGPEGHGYVVTASAILAGELWQRSVNTGPETWRELAWHIVPPDDERGAP